MAYYIPVDFRLLANEIDQSTYMTQLHVIFERRTMYKNHVKLDHMYGLINFIRKQSEIDCIYLSLSARTDPREQTILVAKAALIQEI